MRVVWKTCPHEMRQASTLISSKQIGHVLLSLKIENTENGSPENEVLLEIGTTLRDGRMGTTDGIAENASAMKP